MSSASVTTFSVFLLAIFLPTIVANVDIDRCAFMVAGMIASETKTPYVWYDIYAKQPHIQEEYPEKMIEARVENVKYDTKITKLDRPGYTYTQWFHNGGSLPIKNRFFKTKTVSSSFEWSITESLKIGVELSVAVGVPGVVDGNVKVNTELNLASTQGQTKTTKETFTIQQEVIVPPKTSVKAVMTVTETEVDVPWTADVYMKGRIAIWLKNKWNGHHLWFYNIVPKFAKCSKDLATTSNGLALKYVTKGIFKSVQAVRATITTEEHPLQY